MLVVVVVRGVWEGRGGGGIHLCAAQICDGDGRFLPAFWQFERIPRNLAPPHTVPPRLALWALVSEKPLFISILAHPYGQALGCSAMIWQ